jgi:hypothetical protein
MIALNIKVQNGKITTACNKSGTKLSEVALLLYEFERIKRELMKVEITPDFEIRR